MDLDFLKKYIYPVATLSGAIIGVGFFALPFIAMKAGAWLMLFYFLILTSLVIVIHLIFSEISLKTPDFKRLPGFVKYHLGKWPGRISLVSNMIGYFALLLVYLVVGSSFLTNIFFPVLGGNQFHYAIIYSCLAGLLIYFGIKIISKVELAVLCFLIICLLAVFISGFSQIKIENIFAWGTGSGIWNLFLPYGAVMFALWGVGIIPEVEEMLGSHSAPRGNKKILKKAIIAGTLIPAFVYIIFTFGILSISGQETTETAFEGLKNFLGAGIISLGFLLGVVTTFVGFIISGLTLRKILNYDLGVKKLHAFVITCFVPLILFLLGLNSFVALVSFIGGILLGIDGIFILLMYKKIGGKNIIVYPLSLVFLLGVIYEIIYFVK
jgi:amino acid permease